MSRQDFTSSTVTSKEEAPFEINELFFSRTDDRGVIISGNEVFRRISGYTWDELVGAPHKIIRHPDMPKGVFYILWERLKRGLATGAYVENRAKDGQYYWVYAIFSPVDGGYVSVRLKPTSSLFESVITLYAEALNREQEDGLLPVESAENIRAKLRDLGFPSYSAFSSYAVAQEVIARDDALARVEDERLQSLIRILPVLEALDEQHTSLFASFAKTRGIPSNMRIVASRLEPAGGPISAISQNYRLMSDEASTHLGSFQGDDGSQSLPAAVAKKVYGALFMMAASSIQCEVKNVAAEGLVSGVEADGFQGEVDILNQLSEDYMAESRSVLQFVCSEAMALARSAKDLRQLVTGLDSIRVLCRVEAGRLGAQSVALTPVINQLDRFHVEIDSTLEQILTLADKVAAMIETSMARSFNCPLDKLPTAERNLSQVYA